AELLPLMRSPFVGVRVNALTAIANLSRPQPWPTEQMTQLCRVLAGEQSQTVTRLFYDWVADWVRKQEEVPSQLVVTLAATFERVIAQNALEGGIGRSLVAALKMIARSEAKTLDSTRLSQVVRQLLRGLHLIQVDNGESEMIDVLCAMHRLNPDLLSVIVEQDFPIFLQHDQIRNVSAVVKTIAKLEGSQAPLLNEVVQRYGERASVESLVLEARGL
ncbi:hypothetical protein, partial [Almyronema epifaneia]